MPPSDKHALTENYYLRKVKYAIEVKVSIASPYNIFLQNKC